MTLLVVGTHGHRRMTEILIGGVAGELLHSASCSVLVARRPAEPERFPRSIVVGVDGSAGSEDALHAAGQLARRFQVPMSVVTATQGDDVDLVRARRWSPEVETIDARPVDSLVAASGEVDLLVVGSRGRRGIQALGSVSERVAHNASCSVLVARSADRGLEQALGGFGLAPGSARDGALVLLSGVVRVQARRRRAASG